jgi:hypothetical protein
LKRFDTGDSVFVVSWDCGGTVLEDCETGYYVQGENLCDFVSDIDVEGVASARIGDADESA